MSAVEWSKRTSGPPIETPKANATKRHEQPVVISKPSADGCLTKYLPTSPCYSGLSLWWFEAASTRALALLVRLGVSKLVLTSSPTTLQPLALLPPEHDQPAGSLGPSGVEPAASMTKSFIWTRKKSPICGMCSAPLRYYNLINR